MKRDNLVFIIVGILFLCFVLFLLFETHVFQYYESSHEHLGGNWKMPTSNPIVVFPNPISTGVETLYDAQSPPKQMNTATLPNEGIGAVPININTNAHNDMYSQVGLLTMLHTHTNTHPTILPLMGRVIHTSRNKWQYYAIGQSIGAGMQIKLPIFVDGKIASVEYGCDKIENGDVVKVEGYKDVFRATIYETGLLDYIPII